MTDDIGHTSDADRVEEIREGLTLKYERMRDGGRLRVVRGDISLADARFLLAQYDALKAENGKLREVLTEARKALTNADCHKKAFGIGGDRSTHWYLVDELVRNIDAALGREGGEDDGEADTEQG